MWRPGRTSITNDLYIRNQLRLGRNWVKLEDKVNELIKRGHEQHGNRSLSLDNGSASNVQGYNGKKSNISPKSKLAVQIALRIQSLCHGCERAMRRLDWGMRLDDHLHGRAKHTRDN